MKSLYIASGAIKVAVLAAGLAMSSVSSAAQFGVRVVDDAGQPVSGASVCFGLPGSYRQFGTQFTDADGLAMADVPNIPFVVTVSKTRFSGIRINEPGRGFNLIKQVALIEGKPGPRCKAGSTLADADASSVRISKVEVLHTGRVLALKPEATGNPTEYRVSSKDDLFSSGWESLEDTIRLSESLARQEAVHLQLRRYESVEGGWLEALSRAITVHLPASNPSL